MDILRKTLTSSVEGTCSGEYGYIISVLSIDKIGSGRITNNGYAVFSVLYQALVLKPLKGEIIDASIVETNDMGIFAGVGPLTIFISNYQIPKMLLKGSEGGGLEKNSNIRLKIIGTKVEATRIYAIGTINEYYLGLIC
ncbi:subunit Rpb7 of DNA-directed RNA polymerase II [Hamiltosporidium magnivora]|uniref:Subunit Rpb7 of DNA-directed RNA polymerase II n=1 Tax=Hamiltosporidium magnivora TaxID=148818 RepID=A0A4V2JUT8_9MICR|nr:putative subunit Rpb7 of DNA-directed RNA polymerase II [Hamiltosporidium magnivora]TBU01837.1 subunit Rpb7 of DNA-directed RNA polymerase II [Hamiltosporidium magnivora]